MTRTDAIILILFIYVCLFMMKPVQAQFMLNLETGIVFTEYNEARIPGSTGTLISFSDELLHDPQVHVRAHISYRVGKRSQWLLLWAPLQVAYTGISEKHVLFQGESFEPGTALTATYRFNSYRATYRYYLWQQQPFELAVGITAKVRDALIRLEAKELAAEKTDLGVVPLIHFMLRWTPLKNSGLLLQADALGVRQGRAADVLLAWQYHLNERIGLNAGYRMLEGGSDAGTVYTFSMFHYAVIGLCLQIH